MSASPVVYVVDDDPSVRKATGRTFRAAGYRVELFETADAFLAHAREDAPGCLILDVELPGQSGIELHEQLSSDGFELPVVFMTGHGDIPMSVKAMKDGAADFLPKPVDRELLLETVDRALAAFASRRAAAVEVREFRRRLEALTPREWDVLALVVAGLLNKQIATELGISLDTVKIHRGRVMRKAGVDSLAELARLWERAGLAAGPD